MLRGGAGRHGRKKDQLNRKEREEQGRQRVVRESAYPMGEGGAPIKPLFLFVSFAPLRFQFPNLG